MAKVATSYYIEPNQKAKLEILSAKKRVAQSELVREALDELFTKYAEEGEADDLLMDQAEQEAHRAGYFSEKDIDRLVARVRARKRVLRGKP
ncbi:MAG: ribbon-helix-helix domain-containing protein [Acidobacteria bacterium]|nr:ribbon-helix-helix domain-containing protein [Acidobacteriota bacterium]